MAYLKTTTIAGSLTVNGNIYKMFVSSNDAYKANLTTACIGTSSIQQSNITPVSFLVLYTSGAGDLKIWTE